MTGFANVIHGIESFIEGGEHKAVVFFEQTLTAIEPAVVSFFETNGIPIITAAAAALSGGTAVETVIATALAAAKDLVEKAGITVGALVLHQVAGELVAKASAQTAGT